MVTVGQGTQQTELPLFRRLLPHGTLFTNVDPSDGLEVLLTEIRSRAQQYPLEYGHWSIGGGEPQAGSKGVQGLTLMSYARLVPAGKCGLSLLKPFPNRAGGRGTVRSESIESEV